MVFLGLTPFESINATRHQEEAWKDHCSILVFPLLCPFSLPLPQKVCQHLERVLPVI